jgi:ribonucleoside-diphosphate reductase alpha chain
MLKPDYTRDVNIADFGKTTLKDRYQSKQVTGDNTSPQEDSPQDLFIRVAKAYANDEAHASRIYDYISKLWFMPASPILSNGGLPSRGESISCFLNEILDSMDDIASTFHENMHLASNGGGIGTYYGNMRGLGEVIKNKGQSSGVIPFIKMQDAATLAINQGGMRRGTSAVYLDVSHPEIEEFIDIRRPTGDAQRRSLNMNHAVILTDAFMQEVEKGGIWELKNIQDGKVVKTVPARELWIKILTTRIETGEPYLLFIDTVNKSIPEHHKVLDLKVKTSNLCNEITLPTGIDYAGKKRTAVCCLSSLNLEKYEEWKDNEQFIEDVLYFLDNVLTSFTQNTKQGLANARYSALQERSIGLGVMGFHSFLQSKSVPFASVMAKSWNKKIFVWLKETADKVNTKIANERGSCPDVIEAQKINPNLPCKRFSNVFAIAPNANIANICGESSPGIEPYAANSFTQKTLSGSFIIKNKHLKKLLQEKGKDTDHIWSSIAINDGSVQHLDFLTPEEKMVFQTAFEIDQKWIIEHASDRQPFICQSQSVNLFLVGNASKAELHAVHFLAWKKGLKGLYYCRSRSIQRADKVSTHIAPQNHQELNIKTNEPKECLACQ